MISVVIPLYNKADTIRRAIHSVLQQTLQPDEIIVVDDGSTDHSAAQLPQHPLLRLIRQENAGVSAARNRGIAESAGDLIAFLDADDEWKPDFLLTVQQLSERYPDCSLFATAYEQLDPAGVTHPIRLSQMPVSEDEGRFINYFEVAAHSDPPISSISILVRRAALQAIGGFPVGIRQGEDLLTWARLAFRYPIAYSTRSLAIYHNDGHPATEPPKRIPPADDPVGQQLQVLYDQQPQTPGLRAYLAHWHKMRASIYLRLPHLTRSCRKEIRLSRHFAPNPKLHLYTLLTCIPYRLRIKLINLFIN